MSRLKGCGSGHRSPDRIRWGPQPRAEGDLARIIHVGPVIAARIVQARPFDSLDDLLQVSGIGEARLVDIAAQGVACVAPES